MQVKALLLCTLFTLGACQTATPEPEPSSTSQVDAASGLVSYVLTYDQDISEAALQRKCDNLNCTQVIYGIIKAIVVVQDPTGVQTLSEDPLLTATTRIPRSASISQPPLSKMWAQPIKGTGGLVIEDGPVDQIGGCGSVTQQCTFGHAVLTSGR